MNIAVLMANGAVAQNENGATAAQPALPGFAEAVAAVLPATGASPTIPATELAFRTPFATPGSVAPRADVPLAPTPANAGLPVAAPPSLALLASAPVPTLPAAQQADAPPTVSVKPTQPAPIRAMPNQAWPTLQPTDSELPVDAQPIQTLRATRSAPPAPAAEPPQAVQTAIPVRTDLKPTMLASVSETAILANQARPAADGAETAPSTALAPKPETAEPETASAAPKAAKAEAPVLPTQMRETVRRDPPIRLAATTEPEAKPAGVETAPAGLETKPALAEAKPGKALLTQPAAQPAPAGRDAVTVASTTAESPEAPTSPATTQAPAAEPVPTRAVAIEPSAPRDANILTAAQTPGPIAAEPAPATTVDRPATQPRTRAPAVPTQTIASAPAALAPVDPAPISAPPLRLARNEARPDAAGEVATGDTEASAAPAELTTEAPAAVPTNAAPVAGQTPQIVAKPAFQPQATAMPTAQLPAQILAAAAEPAPRGKSEPVAETGRAAPRRRAAAPETDRSADKDAAIAFTPTPNLQAAAPQPAETRLAADPQPAQGDSPERRPAAATPSVIASTDSAAAPTTATAGATPAPAATEAAPHHGAGQSFAAAIDGAAPSAPAAVLPTQASAPVHAAQPIVSARAGEIGREMGVEIARRVSSGREELVVRLNPEHMGRIEVRMAYDDGGTLRAVVQADNPAALDLLRRDSADLTRSLTDAGVRADSQSFRFDQRSGSDGGQPRQQQPGQSSRFAETDQPVLAEEIPEYRRVRTSGSVDVIA